MCYGSRPNLQKNTRGYTAVWCIYRVAVCDCASSR